MKLKITKELEITILIFVLFFMLLSSLLKLPALGVIAIFMILALTIEKLINNWKEVSKK